MKSTLFCPHCSKIQPAPGAIIFLSSDWCRNWISISACSSTSSTSSAVSCIPIALRALGKRKRWSLADTALLNDAYRTLRDPIRRTEYLLKLHGAEIGEEHAGKDRKDPSRVPADLLEEAFDLNMQLEEMRMSKKMGDTDPDLQSEPRTGKEEIQRHARRRRSRSACAMGRYGTTATKTPVSNRKTNGLAARSQALCQQPRPRRNRTLAT